MTINITVTGPVTITVTENEEIISKLEQIISAQKKEEVTDLATAEEFRALLGRVDAATNDIAADIQDLLNKPEVPEELKTEFEPIVARLEGIASAYPVPNDPVPPEENPGEEPLPDAGETGGTGEGGAVNP